MLYNRDNLLHNLAIVVGSWTIIFLCFGLPIFHLGLSVSVPRIALFCALSCALQLSITPWLFFSRATNRNPLGKTRQIALASAIWITSNLFVFLIFIQYGKAANWTTTLLFDGLISMIFGSAIFVVGTFGTSRKA